MDGPKFLWIDANNDVLIADTENHVIRKYFAKDGKIERFIGTAKKGKGGLDGSPLDVELARPHGIGIAPDGSMYLSDSDNNRLLKITKSGK